MAIHLASRRAALFAVLAGALASLVPAPLAGATFPGRDGLIAFSVDTDSDTQLYTVRPDGHGLRHIGTGDEPDFSPDGRHIAITGVRAGIDCVSVDVINPDGTGDVALTSGIGGCQAQPSYAPDGSIVYENEDFATGDAAIWGMNANGGDQHRIVGLQPSPSGIGFAFATDPNVSPDGKTLTFVGWDGALIGPAPAFEPAQGLFSSNLDGSNRTRLLPYALDLANKHDWAPDGSRILVTTNANFLDPADSANCATIEPDGSHLRFLTHFHEPGVNAFCGSYSPDGQSIALRLEDHGSYALYRIRADGSHLHKIIDFSSFKPRKIDWGANPHDGHHDRG